MIDNNDQSKTISLSKKSIIVAIVVVLILVIGAYVLTFVIPTGEYQRDESGSIVQGTYEENEDLDGIAWWQFLLAPIMILSPSVEGSGTVYTIIALLLVIGAVFNALDDSHILRYMVESLAHKYRQKKYFLIPILSFAFMFLGSAVGMFEELIPLVPVVILLCYAMGWDALVGLGISVFAGCLGFAAGVVNPFTVGVSQTLGGIELFSGIEMRLLAFGIFYVILLAFVFPYAKWIDKHPTKSMVYKEDLARKANINFAIDDFKPNPKLNKALKWFAGWMMLIITIAIVAIFWHTLADYVMYITIAIYIIAGVGACVLCDLKGKRLLKLMGEGMVSLMPAIAMILVAGGVRYIVTEGDIMDTILYMAIDSISGSSANVAVLLIYAVIFIFEIFIPSGSAKALLIMPIIYDICTIVGVEAQVAVLAFTFADGISNMILPTNAGLLLILGMTTVTYPKWFKWSIPMLLVMFASTIGILMLAQNVIYV
ncbi:MAG: hypothetical protein R3Y23_05665 [Bacillota bacterium]